MMFDPVTLAMLAGATDNASLIGEANDELARIGRLVAGELTGDKARGSVTIRVSLEAAGGRGVTVSAELTSKEPKLERRGLSAFMSDEGELLTADDRQLPLPTDEDENVRAIRPEKRRGR